MEKKCSKPPTRYSTFVRQTWSFCQNPRRIFQNPWTDLHWSCRSPASFNPTKLTFFSKKKWCLDDFSLVVDLPLWKMMEFVNGKDDIPYMKWKILHSCSKPPIRYSTFAIEIVSCPINSMVDLTKNFVNVYQRVCHYKALWTIIITIINHD